MTQVEYRDEIRDETRNQIANRAGKGLLTTPRSAAALPLQLLPRLLRQFLLAVALVGLVSVNGAFANDIVHELNNGMEFILVENHGSPMVACVIFVKSGAKYETQYENGITHFLEHLLFDGTATKSRVELDVSITRLGGYINAFTRDDLTAYLVLLPSQFIEYGMTVQADMLFNSVFPQDELAKERKVVIEEINSSADSPEAAPEAFFRSHAYAGTAYTRPVLGYREFIERISRDAIIDYWKRYYTPDNMVALVIGDFATDSMKAVVQRVFGKYPAAESARVAGSPDSSDPLSRRRQTMDERARSGALDGALRYDTVAAVSETHVNFSIEGPNVTDPEYITFDLLMQYLATPELSPLHAALTGWESPLATECSVGLTTLEEFTRLDVTVLADSSADIDAIVSTVTRQLAGLPSNTGGASALPGLKTSIRCESIYNAERLHYYGFLIAPLMMSAGWEFIQQYPARIDSVAWEDCVVVAEKYFADPDYIVTAVKPADSTQTPFVPHGPGAEAVEAYFDTAAFPVHDLFAEREIRYPEVDSVALTYTDNSVYHREQLPNGLTVIVKQNDASQVFAVNVLGKNRTIMEPETQTGITDFVNRCLAHGTTARSSAELSEALAAIGAVLTVADNPWIPYDDRYTTRGYSFVKFETIDDYAETGFGLLSDILLNPAFDSLEIEQVRREMLGILARSAGSPSNAAGRLWYESYFADTPFGRDVLGTESTLVAITRANLVAHHRRFYAPNNIILAIVTSHDTADVMQWVRSSFGDRLAVATGTVPLVEPNPVLAAVTKHVDIPSHQVAIYAGGRLPGANSDETVELNIAAGILSSRLFRSLREREGLAYSTGASARFSRDFGWYYLTISTAVDNRDRALGGLSLEADKLAFDGPTREEVIEARNQSWGRLMRAKLSRINQAYYLAVDNFLGRGVDYDAKYVEALDKVSVYAVRAVASKYFRPSAWVIATAGAR